MNKIRKFDLKKFFTLFMALTMALCLAFCVACSDPSNSSSTSKDDDEETTVTATDYQSIKNGDFEFGTSGDKVTYPVYTGINWTRYRDNSYSTSAVSSTKNSGIIDTSDEAYNDIASTNNFPKNSDDTYWNPKTPESLGLGGNRYVYNEETAEDNPNEDKLCTSGTKILMIHNVTATAGRGTAQKFVSSSSLTTSTGYAKISAWVLTKDLKTIQDTTEYGAYISVNNTLSATRNPFVVKNINTQGNWAQYVIYLETSDYVSSSYTVTVGLGFGSDTQKDEYVEGFAYFDEIHFEELDKDEFEAETQGATEYNLFTTTGEEVEADALKISQSAQTYVANENKNATVVKYVFSHLMDATAFEPTFSGDYNKVFQHDKDGYAKGATSGIAEFNTLAIDGVTNPYGETAKTAYIKLSTPSSYTITSNVYAIGDGEYKQYNFLTNVSIKTTGQPGAKIEVEEVKDDTASEVYGTVSVATDYNTYSTDEKGQTWKKVSVFVKNDLGTTRYIRFKFTLGTTDNVFGAADYELTQGYALFTGFEQRNLPENEYNVVSSQADYKSTITLGYEYPNGPVEDDDDETDYAFNATTATKQDLQTKPANGVSGYTGVVGGHTMVGGENTDYASDNVVAGVVSSKYANAYSALSDAEKTAIANLAGTTEIQPVMIKNTASASYGYLGSQLSLTANTTTLISVQVKVLSGSAYVYLANADPLSYFGTLTVNEKPMMIKVTADNQPTASDKWVTVNFVITTGNENLSYRVELWNGTRDGATQEQGTVLFNNVTTSSSVNLTALTAKIEADFVASDADVKTTSYTREPVTVKYTDAEGNEAEYTRTFTETVVCTEYVKGATIVASYETIHAEVEIDETTAGDDDTSSDDSSSEETVTTNDQTANWALQLVSIIIAAVLVLVLIVVVIRMIVKKNKKVQISSANYYNRNSREKAQAIINANKAKRAQQAKEAQEDTAETDESTEAETVEETTEETEETAEEKPYDYDNPENNI